MARYLSPEWFNEMSAAAAKASLDFEESSVSGKTNSISLREIIRDTPFGEVSYTLTIKGGVIEISHYSLDGQSSGTPSISSSNEEPDVTFSQDYATASQLHRGELTTQDAFFQGRIRVGGHLNILLENSDLLQGVAPIFAEVRNNTTYD